MKQVSLALALIATLGFAAAPSSTLSTYAPGEAFSTLMTGAALLLLAAATKRTAPSKSQ